MISKQLWTYPRGFCPLHLSGKHLPRCDEQKIFYSVPYSSTTKQVERVPYIANVAVQPRFRRQGAAQQLLDHAEEFAKVMPALMIANAPLPV